MRGAFHMGMVCRLARLLLDRFADGWSYDDILEAYPHLMREQVQAAVAFAAELFKEERFVAIDRAES